LKFKNKIAKKTLVPKKNTKIAYKGLIYQKNKIEEIPTRFFPFLPKNTEKYDSDNDLTTDLIELLVRLEHLNVKEFLKPLT
jgi:hypothetical protein